jgi:hypothetical protein
MGRDTVCKTMCGKRSQLAGDERRKSRVDNMTRKPFLVQYELMDNPEKKKSPTDRDRAEDYLRESDEVDVVNHEQSLLLRALYHETRHGNDLLATHTKALGELTGVLNRVARRLGDR